MLLCYYGRHVTMQAIDLSEALQLWDGVILGVPGCQRACFDDYILSAGFSSTITISIQAIDPSEVPHMTINFGMLCQLSREHV